jgi:hypothetical protein
LRTWLSDLSSKVKKASTTAVDFLYLRTTNSDPTRYQDGEIRIADGTNWNPRFGQGPYYYSSTDSEWKGFIWVGSGGSVTQSTNKTTAVTLDKTTGQITMNNANLAAGAQVAFTFNNATLKANDLLVINQQNSTLGAYIFNPVITAAGSATITVTNISAGALAEAVRFRFTRIPGSTS